MPKKAQAAERVPFLDLKAHLRALEPELRAALDRTLVSADLVLGAAVERFEAEFARFCGAAHAVGVSNGLDALRLALIAAGVGPRDEVVVPASTYIATALAVSSVGASVKLADCDPATWNLSPEALEKALTKRTKAVIAVHLAGQPADMDAIGALARRRKLAVLEDAAHAAGASYRGKRAGALGHLGCFSFYPTKNLGALGDAGCVTTGDAKLAARLRRLRNYGQRVKYEHVEKGVNARLDSLQAAVLSAKLPRLEAWNAARASRAAFYRERLAGVGDLAFQAPQPGAGHAHHLFLVDTGRRDALQAALRRAGVGTLVHYPTPIHLQPAYAELRLGPGSFPHAERRAERTLSLPLYPELPDESAERVCAAARRFFGARA